MTTRNGFFISREALPVAAAAAVLAAVAYAADVVMAGHGLALLALLVAFLARNPRCQVPPAPLGVVSPVHGRVLVAGKGADPYLARDALHVRVRMLPWHAHVVRSPVEGEVEKHWLSRDKGVWPMRRYALHIRTDEGDDVVLVFNLGLLAPLARVLPGPGDRVGQGQRCGYVYLGAVLDIYLSADSNLVCVGGDTVRAGSSLLGHFVR